MTEFLTLAVVGLDGRRSTVRPELREHAERVAGGVVEIETAGLPASPRRGGFLGREQRSFQQIQLRICGEGE